MKARGEEFALEDGAIARVTVHPSYLLRLPDQEAKAEAYARFVVDLREAAKRAETLAA